MSSSAAVAPTTAPEPSTTEPSTTEHSAGPLAAAKPPIGSGAVTALGMLLAVLVVALGVAGVHDALVASGAVTGTSWLEAATGSVDGFAPGAWALVLGIVLALVGLWLLLKALTPRRPSDLALQAGTGVFLRPRDAARLARAAAQDVDGVVSATSTATRRTVSVTVRTTSPNGVEAQVQQAVTDRLQGLADRPRVRVTVKTEGGSR